MASSALNAAGRDRPSSLRPWRERTKVWIVHLLRRGKGAPRRAGRPSDLSFGAQLTQTALQAFGSFQLAPATTHSHKRFPLGVVLKARGPWVHEGAAPG